MRAARLLFVILAFTAVSEASVIYTYRDTQWSTETPSYNSPPALQTVGFSLTTGSYLTTSTWFYTDEIGSCQPFYGEVCNQVLLAQETPETISVDLLFDGGTTDYAYFPDASLTQDGTYWADGEGGANCPQCGQVLTVSDPPSAPEPSTWLLSASGIGLLCCTRRWVRR
jgi:hypothetical protein